MPEQRARGRGRHKPLLGDHAARACFHFGGHELASCPDGCLAVRGLQPDEGGALGVDQSLAPGQHRAHESAAFAHELAKPEIGCRCAPVKFAASDMAFLDAQYAHGLGAVGRDFKCLAASQQTFPERRAEVGAD